MDDASDADRRWNTRRLLPTSRLDAFSDGVFAIVITLLVLELDVPADGDRLAAALLREWPSFLGYLVSFAFIGGVWLAHSNLTGLLRATDGVLLRLNLLLLLAVSFLPFTTSLMYAHLADSGQRVAVLAFGANLTVAALMINLLIAYVVHSEEMTAEAGRAQLSKFKHELWSVAVLMALSTAGGAFWPELAVVFFLAVSLVLLLEPLRLIRRR